MITQKHGRKLASQLGEVLFICQFLRLADSEERSSLSLRNVLLHLVCVCVCVCVLFLHKGITTLIMSLFVSLFLPRD